MVVKNIVILYVWQVPINKMDILAKGRRQRAVRLPSVDYETKYRVRQANFLF
jgi:hypothetical protein